MPRVQGPGTSDALEEYGLARTAYQVLTSRLLGGARVGWRRDTSAYLQLLYNECPLIYCVKYMKRPPTLLELERLQTYARLIRHLELSGHPSTSLSRLDSGVLAALSADRSESILPNLLTLKVTENARQALDNVYLLIGEKLTSLSLDLSAIQCDEVTGCSLLDTLRTTSPFIEKLYISGCVRRTVFPVPT